MGKLTNIKKKVEEIKKKKMNKLQRFKQVINIMRKEID